METDLQKQIAEALNIYFNQGVSKGKFIDVSRIPLICQDVHNINEELKIINEKLDKKFVTKDSFWPVKTVTYSLVGLIMTGFIVALISLVFKQ